MIGKHYKTVRIIEFIGELLPFCSIQGTVSCLNKQTCRKRVITYTMKNATVPVVILSVFGENATSCQQTA